MFEHISSLPLLFALAAFVAVSVLIPPMRKLAKKIGHTDKPGGRKEHVGQVPLIGGLVIFPVFIVVSALASGGFSTLWPLYSALVLLLATGAIDDRVHLRSWTKFAMQFIAAFLIVIPGGAEIHELGNLFGLGPVGLGPVWLPFSVVSVVLLINALNLMDGLDGLAGGAGLIMLFWFLIGCLLVGDQIYAPSILILMAALAGFLIYNMRNPMRRKASVFLGDAGSMCLGLMVAWYAIQLSPVNGRILEPMSVAWILAIPIWDECAQFYRRVREGRHPFSPDRGHFHHHFINAGFSAGKAVSMILGMILLSGFVGIVSLKVGVPVLALTVVWIMGILTHMFLSKDLEKYPSLISTLFPLLTTQNSTKARPEGSSKQSAE